MKSRLSLAVALLAAWTASAHQPIMDMAPRWRDGWGVQYFHEYIFGDDLLSGTRFANNPNDLYHIQRIHWLEGVYTFQREARVTFKLPYHNQERKISIGGTPTTQRGEGLGDLRLSVPFKYYENRKGLTWNVGIAPMLRVPTGETSGGWSPGDGSWDPGVSVSASFETPEWYHFYDLWYWKNTRGSGGKRHGAEAGLDINIGRSFPHPEEYMGAFVMLDVAARWRDRGRGFNFDTGGESIAMGPVLVFFKGNWMLRLEYRVPVYERRIGSQVGNDHRFAIGLGVAF